MKRGLLYTHIEVQIKEGSKSPLQYTLNFELRTLNFSGAPSGRSRRLPSTSRPPGTAYSRRLVFTVARKRFPPPAGAGGCQGAGLRFGLQPLNLRPDHLLRELGDHFPSDFFNDLPCHLARDLRNRFFYAPPYGLLG